MFQVRFHARAGTANGFVSHTQVEGRHSLTKEAEDWGRDAQPALEAAMGAALQPLFAAQADEPTWQA